MYTYYSLDEALLAPLAELQTELGRPIWVTPGLPSSRLAMAQQGSRLVDAQRELEMPHLTADQLAELAVIVIFEPTPTVRCDGREETFGDQDMTWFRPRAMPPMPLFLSEEDTAAGRPFAYVEPGVVACLVGGMPWLTSSSEDGRRGWELIHEGVRLAASDDLERRFEEIRRAQVRTRLTESIRAHQESAITNRRARISSLESEVREHESYIRDKLVRLRESATELDLLIAMREQDAGERMLEEYDKLSEHPRVTKIDVVGHELLLTTDHVHMTHPTTDETRWLGRFLIKIAFSGSNITIKNLDNPRNGLDHPHVAEGAPCFGGHERDFSELVAQGRWLVFFEMLLQYLETFNPRDDWGRRASYWFEVPDRDPSSPPPEDDRPILGHDDAGNPVREGDRIAFLDDDGRDASGIAVAHPSTDRGFACRRDDGRGGGGPGGTYSLSHCDEVLLAAVPQTA